MILNRKELEEINNNEIVKDFNIYKEEHKIDAQGDIKYMDWVLDQRPKLDDWSRLVF